MRSSQPIPKRPWFRLGLYVALFVFLVAVSFYAAGPMTGARAAESIDGPSIGTIPPGGTIPTPLTGQINVLHLAPFAPDINDTGVEICDSAGDPIGDPLLYEEETGYVNLPVGNYTWSVALADTDCGTVVLEIPKFRLLDQERLLLIVYGDNDNQPLDFVFVIVQEGLESTYLPLAARPLEDPE